MWDVFRQTGSSDLIADRSGGLAHILLERCIVPFGHSNINCCPHLRMYLQQLWNDAKPSCILNKQLACIRAVQWKTLFGKEGLSFCNEIWDSSREFRYENRSYSCIGISGLGIGFVWWIVACRLVTVLSADMVAGHLVSDGDWKTWHRVYSRATPRQFHFVTLQPRLNEKKLALVHCFKYCDFIIFTLQVQYSKHLSSYIMCEYDPTTDVHVPGSGL